MANVIHVAFSMAIIALGLVALFAFSFGIIALLMRWWAKECQREDNPFSYNYKPPWRR